MDRFRESIKLPQLPLNKRECRIHFLTTDFPPSLGGLQSYSAQIATKLPGIRRVDAGLSGHTPHEYPIPRGSELEYHFHWGSNRLAAALWSSLAVLGQVLKQRKKNYSTVCLHMQWNTALLPWLLTKIGYRIRYVILIHGTEFAGARFFTRLLMRAIFTNADAVIAGSHFTSKYFQSKVIKHPQLRVVPYGMEAQSTPNRTLNSALPSAEKPLQFLCIHRLVPRKGSSLLLHALAQAKLPPWQLTLIGDGPEKKSLLALSKKLNLAAKIHFAGSCSEEQKHGHLQKADLFILPSLPPDTNATYIEGLGLVLLEAQMAQLPVLAALTGGIVEAFEPGKTGEGFKAGSLSDLTQALEKLGANHALLTEYGKQGPDWIKSRFSWDKTINEIAQIISVVATDTR